MSSLEDLLLSLYSITSEIIIFNHQNPQIIKANQNTTSMYYDK